MWATNSFLFIIPVSAAFNKQQNIRQKQFSNMDHACDHITGLFVPGIIAKGFAKLHSNQHFCTFLKLECN